MTAQELFDELSYYTLVQPRVTFIHQHAVDAFGVQTATSETKTIGIVFGLIGLYLYLDRGYSGLEVQNAHVAMSRGSKQWHRPNLPDERGGVTVAHVLSAEPGPVRDAKIREWCESVWVACACAHEEIREMAARELGL